MAAARLTVALGRTMRVIGVFKELEPQAELLPGFNELRNSLNPEVRGRVAKYLSGGVPVFDVMGASRDPENPEHFIPGGPSLISDGEWVWRNDLQYFVANYGIGLPEEFVRKAMAGNIKLNESEIIAIWEKVLEAYERAVSIPAA